MKILVTGAKGQLGSELCLLSKILPYQFRFIDAQQLDIVHTDAVHAFFAENHYDFCINTAAYTAVDTSEKEKLKAFEVNVKGTTNLAKACAEHNVKLIHISTDFVFGGKNCIPYHEEDTTSPLSVYGMTKLQSENAALSCNPQSIILRTAWLYSSFGNNFVKTILRVAREKGKLMVVYDQVGTPTYAADLASAIIRVAERAASSENNSALWGIYHYSNEGVASWYDFAHAILDITQTTAQITPVLSHEFPTLAERPSFSVLDKGKIKNTFGIKIPHWRESLVKCLSEHNF
jgi:dTDP-4-dehydrorhamnose reductase